MCHLEKPEARGRRQEDVTKGAPCVGAGKIRASNTVTRVIVLLTEA